MKIVVHLAKGLVLLISVYCLVSWRLGEEKPITTQIPILSYHNIQSNPKNPSAYFISTAAFEQHIKFFKEKGFRTVLPEDIFNHYVNGTPLPEKPIMLSFDDNRKEHATIVAPILEKYGYKGTFFIMTVSIGKKNYMTISDIKQLSTNGHSVEHHTYDHQDLRKLPEAEWRIQIDNPRKKLEEITGKKVNYLAYPFGLCNDFAVKELKKRNFKGAFQLSGRQDADNPLLTIRRLIVSGTWTGERLLKEINTTFTKKV